MIFDNEIEFQDELKYTCTDCDNCVYTESEALHGEHPFLYKVTVIGCPECGGLGNEAACQVDNCKKMSQAGINYDGRYRHVCSSHYLDIRSSND